jgi:GH15 family glucan-1,4-alpha-glucosidase
VAAVAEDRRHRWPHAPHLIDVAQPRTAHTLWPSETRSVRIGDYGAIGDCRSAALISSRGSIDWLCWPRFDSPSIFSALLDSERGGSWSVCPEQTFEAEHSYVRDTNVLATHFQCAAGRATLTDLMPVASEEFKAGVLFPDHQLIREVRVTAGRIDLQFDFWPRPAYGKDRARIRSMGALGWRIDVGSGAYWLRSTIPLAVSDERAVARFTLQEGESAQFSLTYAEESPSVLPALGEPCAEAIECTVNWWQQWTAQCHYEGPYREAVTRSALALKLLTYAPSGAVIAAATTSLPERIGDSLNWDYRFCWLRDASLTVRALLGLGYTAEAESFLTWMLHATRLTQPELRILYTIFGRIGPQEQILEHLSGYRDSRPVRIGNAARNQLQLDVYGEVVEATAQYAQYLGKFDLTTRNALIGLGEYVARNWDQPDEGIWERRVERRDHTHSRLMCWTALDRLLALNEKGLLPGLSRELFERERDRIRTQIESRAWNTRLESYVDTLDGDEVDATLLRLAWYGFEHADSWRMKKTYERVRSELGAGDGLLYRYRREPAEGAFGICSSWEIEHLALGGGTLEEAHRALLALLKYRNKLGLFAEEVDPQSGDALGNFPQAFTHVGLISAALTLAEQEKGKAQPAAHVGSDVKASRGKAEQP